MNQIAPAHFWILHYALIDCHWLMVPSIGHAPWKDDTFLRNFQQTQACITDELGENSLDLVTKHEVWSVFIEGLPVFLIMAPLWDKVYFPRGKGFSYGTNLQLRRAVLSPWFCLRWFKQPLGTNLHPLATDLERGSLLVCPQNQLIANSGKWQSEGSYHSS